MMLKLSAAEGALLCAAVSDAIAYCEHLPLCDSSMPASLWAAQGDRYDALHQKLMEAPTAPGRNGYSYRNAIEWIALNDEPTCMKEEAVAGQISIALVADLFQKSEWTVAIDVCAARLLRQIENDRRKSQADVSR